MVLLIIVHWAVGSMAWGPGLRALAGSFGPGVLGHGVRGICVHLPYLLLGSGPLWSLVHWAVGSIAWGTGLLGSPDWFPGALGYWHLCSFVSGPGA